MDGKSYYIYLAPIFFGIPIAMLIFSMVIAGFSKVKHGTFTISAFLVSSYNFIGYMHQLFMRILLVPFAMLVLRTFGCSSTEQNIAEEAVQHGLDTCWNGTHIAFMIFGGVSLVVYCGTLAASVLGYSSNYFESPFPWADDPVFMQAIVLVQKFVLSILLIFDPLVLLPRNVRETIRRWEWRFCWDLGQYWCF